ncbi:MAG: hypothetical protein ABIL39_05580 [candidate division WOR-3 bacterium]
MVLLAFYLFSYEMLVNHPLPEVALTAQRVITESGYAIGYRDENDIVTVSTEFDIRDLHRYIIEEFSDENPGWTQARVQIFVKIRAITTENTKIEINAVFERFGTPSVLLLIPPHWRNAASNGNLEKELMDKIIASLPTKGEK